MPSRFSFLDFRVKYMYDKFGGQAPFRSNWKKVVLKYRSSSYCP